MYGPEYLDWCDETRVAGLIDEFLAAMPAEDRVWALAVLRKRHTVYKDGPAAGLGRMLSGTTAHQFDRQQQCGQPYLGYSGSVLGSLFGLR